MADARGFALAIEDWITKEVPQRAAELQREIVVQAFTGIVQSTPVGNATKWKNNVARASKGLPPLPKGYVGGQARRNWQVSLDIPARTKINGADASGNQALSDGYAVVAKLTAPGRVWISNPLDYMEPLENGWSKQAPVGMVAQAIAAVTARYAGGAK